MCHFLPRILESIASYLAPPSQPYDISHLLLSLLNNLMYVLYHVAVPPYITMIAAIYHCISQLLIKLHVLNVVCYLQSQCAAISTMCRISPSCLLPKMVDVVMLILKNPSLHTVTRREYEIMLHREGDLYDKSVIARWVTK